MSTRPFLFDHTDFPETGDRWDFDVQHNAERLTKGKVVIFFCRVD
jgi:hypothetical protein